jgi:hypothetical protein
MAEFNLEGLLGNIGNAFGGGGGNYLDEYLTPEQRAAMQRNAMLAASAALLKAGGESTRRIGIGEALGGAFEAGQAGYEKAQTGALTQMALKQKLDEAKRAAEFQKTIAGVFNQPTPGQAITPDQALAIPGMAAGPTLERAAMIGQPAPEVDARLQKSKQYSTLASIYAAAGKTEEAARMQKLSDELNPRDELLGGLTQVTDENGKAIMIKQYKSGKIETAPGFGPPREMVLQNVGDKIVAVDKNRVDTGKQFALGMSPEGQAASLVALERLGMDRTQLDAKLKNDAARLGIDQRQLELAIDAAGLNREKFDRDAYERVETEGGNLFLVSRVPGGTSFPILGPSPGAGVAGKPLNVGITPTAQANLDLGRDQFGLSKEQFGLSKDQFAQKVKQDDAQLSISLQQLGLSKDQFAQKVKQDALRMGIDQQNLGLALKRYNLSLSEFARGNYKVQETEAGFSYIPTVPGLPTIPITGGGGEPLKGKGGALTESQSNAFGFAQRMERVNGILAPLEAAGSYPGVGSAVAGSIPFVGGTAQRGVQSADVQRYQQAASDWIRAKLRKESGAAIGVDEAKQEYSTYFPMPNDSAAVIEQKRQARELATNAMKMNAGKTYTSPAPVAPAPGMGGGRPTLNNIFGAPGN